MDPVVDRVEWNDRLADMLIAVFCSCLLTAWELTQKIVSKHLMPSQFQMEGLAFLFSFQASTLNIFIAGSSDHKMRSMQPVPRLLWHLDEL